jgi:hypothetical protein
LFLGGRKQGAAARKQVIPGRICKKSSDSLFYHLGIIIVGKWHDFYNNQTLKYRCGEAIDNKVTEDSVPLTPNTPFCPDIVRMLSTSNQGVSLRQISVRIHYECL